MKISIFLATTKKVHSNLKCNLVKFEIKNCLKISVFITTNRKTLQLLVGIL